MMIIIMMIMMMIIIIIIIIIMIIFLLSLLLSPTSGQVIHQLCLHGDGVAESQSLSTSKTNVSRSQKHIYTT